MTRPGEGDSLRDDLVVEGAVAAMFTYSQSDPDDPWVWRYVSESVLDAFLNRLAERGAIGLVSGLRLRPEESREEESSTLADFRMDDLTEGEATAFWQALKELREEEK